MTLSGSSNDVNGFFAFRGEPVRSPDPSPACLSDEQIAGYVSTPLPNSEREAVETHALLCAECQELLQAVVSVIGAAGPALRPARRPAPAASEPVSLRIVGRLVQRGMQRGLELLNAADLVMRGLSPQAVPLGALRGAPPTADLFRIQGPGSGLDELQVQVQADGTASLTVQCEKPPALRTGEMLSVLLAVDGAPREKRPLGAEPVRFAPIGTGEYRVQVIARAPGEQPRTLAEASLQLSR
jgi:hypothetical protein